MRRGSRVQGLVAAGFDAKVVIPGREIKVPKFPCEAVSPRYRGNRGNKQLGCETLETACTLMHGWDR